MDEPCGYDGSLSHGGIGCGRCESISGQMNHGQAYCWDLGFGNRLASTFSLVILSRSNIIDVSLADLFLTSIFYCI
ncbi:hypothetical protein BDF14DRAFT_1856494, partial [Spinellus fusiger]